MEAADIKGLLGLLLVDGSLSQYSTPQGGYIQLVLTSGILQSAFLEEKVAEFRQFIPTEARIVPYRSKARYTSMPNAQGVVDEGPRFTTVLRFRVSTNKLRPIYNLLYPNGEKQITENVLSLLGASAAAWVWAEGARLNRDGSVTLTRAGTTDLEAYLISQWFQLLTGGESTEELDNNKARPRLLFSPSEAQKTASILLPYAPQSRIHKFKFNSEDSSANEDSSFVLPRQGEHDNSWQQEEASVA